jgi:competence protein ComGC
MMLLLLLLLLVVLLLLFVCALTKTGHSPVQTFANADPAVHRRVQYPSQAQGCDT